MQSGVCLCANAHPGLHPGYEYMSSRSPQIDEEFFSRVRIHPVRRVAAYHPLSQPQRLRIMRRLAPLAFALLIATLAVDQANALSPVPPTVKPQPPNQLVPAIAPMRIWSPQARIPIRLEKV